MPLALAAAVVIVVFAVVAGRQLASFRDRIGAAAPGVVAGKAIYLSPSFNGSEWIQIDPVTLKDLSTRPLLDIRPTSSNSFDTVVSADGSTIIVGDFRNLAAPTRAVYDARTGQLRSYLVPQIGMVIDALSADGTTAIGRIGSNRNALSDPKAIISVADGHVIRTVPAGPTFWLDRTLTAPDLGAIYYITAAVPASESLDVSIQQPLSLIVQSTVTGALSAPVPLPGISMGDILATPGSATPTRSVGPGIALTADGTRLVALSYDGATLDLVDTSTLAVTGVKVHRKTSVWDLLRPLVAEAKELTDQQSIEMRFMPDGRSLVVFVSDRHYGQDGQTVTARAIQRIDLATGLIAAESSAAEGIYGSEVSPDGRSVYLVVRAKEPPAPAYLLRRLDADTLDLKAERALAAYAQLKV
ncbi:MAG: hypothetical protein M3O91_06310, partial [Chloroflexota bacterium]|nr:hypothetical protein [Chloroflexota bacterium]